VLFSIFVMAIGILSIASLIPAAKSLILDAGKSDRATAAGQTALAEIQNRNMLRLAATELWQDVDGDGIYTVGTDTVVLDNNGNGVADLFTYGCVMDPLFLARNAGIAGSTVFPYDPGTAPTNQFYDGSAFPTRLPRTSPFPAQVGTALHFVLADRIFTAQDDTAFALPSGDGARPARVFSRGVDNGWGVQGVDDDGNGVTDDVSEAGWPGSDDTAQITGDYSWIATMIPSESELLQPGVTPTLYTVSVAVFYKRNLVMPDPATPSDVPSERAMFADFVGSGFGGGDVRLRAVPGSDATRDWLNVRPNQWIMLAGWQAAGNPIDPISGNPYYPTINLPEGSGKNRPIFRWYRVAGAGAVEEDPTEGLIRYVTLAGPDWIPSGGGAILVDTNDDGLGDVPNDIDGDNSNGPTVTAFLFDNCIGVFERVIRVETSPLWSN
jgi:hypothetical protein